ncbi:MAG: zinc ABC transporter substrate-binding protein [Magnetovibrio sp.]|nr:zinc ABC transporter substrate-binding protein [Magnetovibrio sp.]
MNALQQIRKLALAVIFTLSPTLAWAGQPNVVSSINPVQGLVLAVMGEDAQPTLLLPSGTSPHTFTLKPSQAKMLQGADIIFWIGPDLESSLQGPLKTLSGKAKVVSLLKTPGLNLLRRDGALDPHIWLSPDNVIIMVNHIRDVLSEFDPSGADLYAKNAKLTRRRLKILKRKAVEWLSSTKDFPYIVQHDGLGYLARDFELNQVGYLQTTPGHEPGAKHLSDISKIIKSKGVRCLFVEPQFTSALANSLVKELGVHTAEVDIMGTDLTTSPTLPLRIIQVILLRMDKCQYIKPKTAKTGPTQ